MAEKDAEALALSEAKRANFLAHVEFSAAFADFNSIWNIRAKARARAKAHYTAALDDVAATEKNLDAKRKAFDPVYAAQRAIAEPIEKENSDSVTASLTTLLAMERDGLVQLDGFMIKKYLKPDDPRVKAWRGQ